MKKIFSAILLVFFIFNTFSTLITYAADQILTAPTPSFIENETQPDSSFTLNRMLLGQNSENSQKTYVKQYLTLDQDKVGGFIFNFGRTKELGASETAEKIKIELYSEDSDGNSTMLAEKLFEGIISIEPTELKWIFPNNQDIDKTKKTYIKIYIDSVNAGNDFPYYIYGTEEVINKPLYFSNMIYFDGTNEKTTNSLLNLTIVRNDSDELDIDESSKYKYTQLLAENNYLIDASDIEVIVDSSLSQSNAGAKCDGFESSKGNHYRVISGKEVEDMMKHSNYFGDIIETISGVNFTNSSLITSTWNYHFNGYDKDKVKTLQVYSHKDKIESGSKFTFCVYNGSQDLVGDTKELDLNVNDEIVLTGLEYNTRKYLTKKDNKEDYIEVSTSNGTLNISNFNITGSSVNTGINVGPGFTIKALGNIAVDNSGLNNADGYKNSNDKYVSALYYKVGNGEWKYAGIYTEIEDEEGELELIIADSDVSTSNNNGKLKVLIEAPITTNTIRENIVYSRLNRNVDTYKIHLGETNEDETSYNELFTSEDIKVQEIKTSGLDFLYNDSYSELEGNSNIAFDGSHFYTVKGNKLIKIGSGLNGTKKGVVTNITLSQSFDEKVLSLVYLKGYLYVGYSKNGLSDYITKISIKTGIIENKKISDSLLYSELGDIKNKKIKRSKYLLSTDGKYLYNISFLLGSETFSNDEDKDKGIYIRIFDPSKGFSLIKEAYISPKITSEGKIDEKITYYTEGFFVDRDYIYIIQKKSSGTKAKVVLINKTNLEYSNNFEIKQDFGNCTNECAVNGLYDYLGDNIVLTNGKSNSNNINFYKKEGNNLLKYNISENIDLDQDNQEKKFKINYEYKLSNLEFVKSYLEDNSGEKIDTDKTVTEGVKLSNKYISAIIPKVVKRNDGTEIGDYNSSILRIYRNKGNSVNHRVNNFGINRTILKVNGKVQTFDKKKASIFRTKGNQVIIGGNRDDNFIVPTLVYELGEEDEFVKGKLILRNESNVEKVYNDNELLISLNGNYDYRDNFNKTKNNILSNATKYVNVNDLDTDDSLFFAIPENDNQRIGVSSGTPNNILFLFNNAVIPANGEIEYDFYIGTRKDANVTSNGTYQKIKNSYGLYKDFEGSFKGLENSIKNNRERLEKKIAKTERLIETPNSSNPDYQYPSNNYSYVNGHGSFQYNDKIGTHFLFPGFDMVTNTALTKKVSGMVHVLPFEDDTIIEIKKLQKDNGAVIGTPEYHTLKKKGENFIFGVNSNFTYEITSNKNVTLVLDSYFWDINHNNSMSDSTELGSIYDVQIGKKMLAYIPGNDKRKGNLFISHVEGGNVTVNIEDITNGATNYNFTMSSGTPHKDITNIGVGQVLYITSSAPITIYYGLGRNAGYNQYVSPSVKKYNIPTHGNTGKKIIYESFEDFNTVNVKDGNTTISNNPTFKGEINKFDINNTWSKITTQKPGRLFVGNPSQSYNFRTSMYSNSNFVGIGNDYDIPNIGKSTANLINDEDYNIELEVWRKKRLYDEDHYKNQITEWNYGSYIIVDGYVFATGRGVDEWMYWKDGLIGFGDGKQRNSYELINPSYFNNEKVKKIFGRMFFLTEDGNVYGLGSTSSNGYRFFKRDDGKFYFYRKQTTIPTLINPSYFNNEKVEDIIIAGEYKYFLTNAGHIYVSGVQERHRSARRCEGYIGDDDLTGHYSNEDSYRAKAEKWYNPSKINLNNVSKMLYISNSIIMKVGSKAYFCGDETNIPYGDCRTGSRYGDYYTPTLINYNNGQVRDLYYGGGCYKWDNKPVTDIYNIFPKEYDLTKKHRQYGTPLSSKLKVDKEGIITGKGANYYGELGVIENDTEKGYEYYRVYTNIRGSYNYYGDPGFNKMEDNGRSYGSSTNLRFYDKNGDVVNYTNFNEDDNIIKIDNGKQLNKLKVNLDVNSNNYEYQNSDIKIEKLENPSAITTPISTSRYLKVSTSGDYYGRTYFHDFIVKDGNGNNIVSGILPSVVGGASDIQNITDSSSYSRSLKQTSRNSDYQHYYTFDLGTNKEIFEVDAAFTSSTNSSVYRKYNHYKIKMEVSTDNIHWTEIYKKEERTYHGGAVHPRFHIDNKDYYVWKNNSIITLGDYRHTINQKVDSDNNHKKTNFEAPLSEYMLDWKPVGVNTSVSYGTPIEEILPMKDGVPQLIIDTPGDTLLKTITLTPKQTYTLPLENDYIYNIREKNVVEGTYNGNNNFHVFYGHGKTADRNTFTTVLKSRQDIRLSDKIVKNGFANQFINYDVIGDFDFLDKNPKSTGEIEINNNVYNSQSKQWLGGTPTRITLQNGETAIIDGLYGLEESNKDDLLIDNISNARYSNGLVYPSNSKSDDNTIRETYGSIRYNDSGLPATQSEYVGGGFTNNTGSAKTYNVFIDEDNTNGNGSKPLYKIYEAGTNLPKSGWEDISKYIETEHNEYLLPINEEIYLSKRNFNGNNEFSYEEGSGTFNVLNSTSSDELTDIYTLPIKNKKEGETLDFLDINKSTTFTFDKISKLGREIPYLEAFEFNGEGEEIVGEKGTIGFLGTSRTNTYRNPQRETVIGSNKQLKAITSENAIAIIPHTDKTKLGTEGSFVVKGTFSASKNSRTAILGEWGTEGGGRTVNRSYIMEVAPNQSFMYFQVNFEEGGHDTCATVGPINGDEIEITATFNTITKKQHIYINGKLNNSCDINSGNYGKHLKKTPTSTTYIFNGSSNMERSYVTMDYFRTYGKELSSGEVSLLNQLYNNDSTFIKSNDNTGSYNVLINNGQIGNYRQYDLSEFVKSGNVIEGDFYFDMYFSDITKTGGATRMEFTNSNNAKGLIISNICDTDLEVNGNGCHSGWNTFRLPIRGTSQSGLYDLNNYASTDWSNIDYIEVYENLDGNNNQISPEYALLGNFKFADISDLGNPKALINKKDKSIICIDIENNKKQIKSICYNNSLEEGKDISKNYKNKAFIKHYGDKYTDRNIFEDYYSLFNNDTTPTRIKSIGFASTLGNYITVYKNIKVNNYTVSTPMVRYSANENIYTEGVPLSHEIKTGRLNVDEYSKVRYIRNTMNGSNANCGNHWIELQAIEYGTGQNKALGKGVSLVGQGSTQPSRAYAITDGALGTYSDAGCGNDTIQIDLGAVYNINKVKVWHYYPDSRLYNNNIIKVSKDGVNWEILYDSNVDGVYRETNTGKIFDLTNVDISNIDNDIILTNTYPILRSCRELKEKTNGTNGIYTIAPEGDTKRYQWILVEEEDLNNVTGWSYTNNTTTCGDWGKIIGGYNVMSNATNEKTYNLDYIEHSEVKVTLDYIALDSWDGGEKAFVELDGNRLYEELPSGSRVPKCGITNSGWDEWKIPIEVILPHTGNSLTVSVGSTLNSGANDESFGYNKLKVYVKKEVPTNIEVYCDMETDGGGWTLIGRGREGWNWTDEGNNEGLVSKNVGTNGAFEPAFYNSDLVDSIVNHTPIKNLPDGLRIKRAENQAGTDYQEVRWKFNSLVDYSWLFDSSIGLSNTIIDNSDKGGGNTRDDYNGANNDGRVFTWGRYMHYNKKGFSYGAFGVAGTNGTNNSTSFLWENGNEQHALPYTELYVRDKVPVTGGNTSNKEPLIKDISKTGTKSNENIFEIYSLYLKKDETNSIIKEVNTLENVYSLLGYNKEEQEVFEIDKNMPYEVMGYSYGSTASNMNIDWSIDNILTFEKTGSNGYTSVFYDLGDYLEGSTNFKIEYDSFMEGTNWGGLVIGGVYADICSIRTGFRGPEVYVAGQPKAKWVHISMEVEPNKSRPGYFLVKIFFDGELKVSTDYTIGSFSNLRHLGYRSLYEASPLKSYLKNLRVTNRSLDTEKFDITTSYVLDNNIVNYSNAEKTTNNSIIVGKTNIVNKGEKGIGKIRYVRDWVQGSNVSTSNLWRELQVFEKDTGTNLALGKIVTSNRGFTRPVEKITDGSNSSHSGYTHAGFLQYVQLDLGELKDIDSVRVYHYANIIFHNTKTEVSADGINWYVLHDSNIDGEYYEGTTGKTFKVKDGRYYEGQDNIQYIRIHSNGNNRNRGNYLYELEAINSNGKNILLGNTNIYNVPTGGLDHASRLTDGIKGENGLYTSLGEATTGKTVEIDLGKLEKISKLNLWMYSLDGSTGRYFHDKRIEVSQDGNNWYSLYDSEKDGEQIETTIGYSYNTLYSKRNMKLGLNGVMLMNKSPVYINTNNRTSGCIDINGTFPSFTNPEILKDSCSFNLFLKPGNNNLEFVSFETEEAGNRYTGLYKDINFVNTDTYFGNTNKELLSYSYLNDKVLNINNFNTLDNSSSDVVISGGKLEVGKPGQSLKYISSLGFDKDYSILSNPSLEYTGNKINSSGNINNSCNNIKADNNKATSGEYIINTGIGGDIKVYCDMETDGGGWTRFLKYKESIGGIHPGDNINSENYKIPITPKSKKLEIMLNGCINNKSTLIINSDKNIYKWITFREDNGLDSIIPIHSISKTKDRNGKYIYYGHDSKGIYTNNEFETLTFSTHRHTQGSHIRSFAKWGVIDAGRGNEWSSYNNENGIANRHMNNSDDLICAYYREKTPIGNYKSNYKGAITKLLENGDVEPENNKEGIRYIRDWLNGSNRNSNNYWVEITAIEKGTKINKALGILPTPDTLFHNGHNGQYLTDGNLNTDSYSEITSGLHNVTIDLGNIYNIESINVLHYNKDVRQFNGTKTEVSKDGINWTTLYDSASEGNYLENIDGETYYLDGVSFNSKKEEKGTLTNINFNNLHSSIIDNGPLNRDLTGTETYEYGWASHIYYKGGNIRFDPNVRRTGRATIKGTIEAGSYFEMREGGATGYHGINQRELKPNTNYRIRGYIKTDFTGDSSHGAFLSILTTNANGVSTGEKHSTWYKGVNDWTLLDFTFTTRPDTRYGHVEFRTYGHTGAATLAGSAWLDANSLVIEEVIEGNLHNDDLNNAPKNDTSIDLYPYGWAKRVGYGNGSTIEVDDIITRKGKPTLKGTINTGSYFEAKEGGATSYHGTNQRELKPNTKYRISGWVKTDFTGDSDHGAFLVFLPTNASGDSKWEWAKNSKILKGKNDWTYLEFNVLTNSEVKYGHLEFQAYGHTGAATLTGSAWLDTNTLRIEELDSNIRTPLTLDFKNNVGVNKGDVIEAFIKFDKFPKEFNTNIKTTDDYNYNLYFSSNNKESKIKSYTRFVKDTLKGSSASPRIHWVEMEAINKETGVNTAINTKVLSSRVYDTNRPIKWFVDGNRDTAKYTSSNYIESYGEPEYLISDLVTYQQLKNINVWHYYGDNRTFYKNKTQTSLDGHMWNTIFDSDKDGEYTEQPEGRTSDIKTKVDGKYIKYAGSLNDIKAGQFYRLLIPVTGNGFEGKEIDKISFEMLGANIEVGDINILRNYSKIIGNNFKIAFDLDVLSSTNRSDIRFGVMSNSNDINKQGYKVIFSKDGTSSAIYRNGVLMDSIISDESAIKEGISKYQILFTKRGKDLFLTSKYKYIEDGVQKTKIAQILKVTDNNPLSLYNAKLIFESHNNQFKVSNIIVGDGEEKNLYNYVKIRGIINEVSTLIIKVKNEFGEESQKIITLYPGVDENFAYIGDLPSFRGRISDVIVIPNVSVSKKQFNIEFIELVKPSDIPSVISSNDDIELIGKAKINKDSKVYQTFYNTKDFIMGFKFSLAKITTGEQIEGMTMKLYEGNADGTIKLDGTGNKILLVEKDISTSNINVYPQKSSIKILFPPVALIDATNYVVELTSRNKDGLYAFGSNENGYTEGFAYIEKKDKTYMESFEFNNIGNVVNGEKGSIGYLGITDGTRKPDREIISGENLKLVGHKDNLSTVTISEDSISLLYNATLEVKGKFTPSNGNSWPMIVQKEIGWPNRIFGLYIDKTETDKLHYSFNNINGDSIAGISTFSVTGTNTILDVSIDTLAGKVKLYKDGNLMETVDIDPSLIGFPLTSIQGDTAFKFMGNHSGWTGDMEIDYFRVYNKTLTDDEVRNNIDLENNYKLPYDLSFYMITKDSDLETIEERTYDVGVGIIKEVDGDLILEGYDAGDGIKRLLLKGNATFRVKGNIIINADEVLILNDNSKTGEDGISYIGFISDNDIIISDNVKLIEGGFFARNAIKTELSNEQLYVHGLMAGNEVDLQNRTYIKPNETCDTITNPKACSVIIEFDKRIYKRTPPLFYQSSNKDGFEIKEE